MKERKKLPQNSHRVFSPSLAQDLPREPVNRQWTKGPLVLSPWESLFAPQFRFSHHITPSELSSPAVFILFDIILHLNQCRFLFVRFFILVGGCFWFWFGLVGADRSHEKHRQISDSVFQLFLPLVRFWASGLMSQPQFRRL